MLMGMALVGRAATEEDLAMAIEGTEVETSRAKGFNLAVSRYILEGAMKITATDGEIAKVTREGRS